MGQTPASLAPPRGSYTRDSVHDADAPVSSDGAGLGIWTLPGVYAPQADTWLLASVLEQEVFEGARVLDLCTGSGALACTAARAGAAHVVAVDRSRRAALTARTNLLRHGHRGRVCCGDLFDATDDGLFDVIVSNPPYVPAATDELPARGRGRAWDAGRDGRALLDRICKEGPGRLRPGGRLLLVHSAIADTARTATMLGDQGLHVEVARRQRIAFGPVMRQRAAALRGQAVIGADQLHEDLVVLCATAPVAACGMTAQQDDVGRLNV